MSDSGDPEVRLTHATLHGHKVAYRVAGDPSLPVVVLLHGISSDSATWNPIMPALAEHAYVIAPDLVGHGESDKPRADYSLGAFASGLRDLLEHLGIDSATIVGHSLGGGIAMQFSYQFPEYCQRLVLVSSGGLGREVSIFLRAASLPGSEYVLPAIANSYVRSAGQSLSKLLRWSPVRPTASVLEAARGYISLADLPARTAFVHTLRSVVEPGGQRVNATDKLYLGADRPTLIIWGARDTIIPVSHAYAAHDVINESQLEIFEQARHFPHQDEPARFARTVIDFLANTQPSVGDRARLRMRLADGGKASA